MIGTAEWLIPTLVYIAGWLCAFRRISGQLAWHYHENRPRYYHNSGRLSPTGEQWACGIWWGIVAGIVWPIALPVAYGLEGTHKGKDFFYVPRDQRVAIQARRIAELEKEAGIGHEY